MRFTRSLLPCIVTVLGAATAAGAQAACYTVYRGSAIVYRSILVPVDLSKPLHATVPTSFGSSATMVIAETTDGCRTVDNRSAAVDGSSPRGTRRSRARSASPVRGTGSPTDSFLVEQAPTLRSEVGADAVAGDRGQTARTDTAPMRPTDDRMVGAPR